VSIKINKLAESSDSEVDLIFEDEPEFAYQSSRMKGRNKPFSLSKIQKLGGLAFIVVLALLFYLFHGFGGSKLKYAVIVDAGSTGSRAHVYPYYDGLSLIELDVSKEQNKKIKPGLSDYATGKIPTSQVKETYEKLIEYVKTVVPASEVSKTPIYVRATAGMRKAKNDNPQKAEKVMEIVRDTLEQSGFIFQRDWATIISGIEEGLYGWVTANYLNGFLKGAEADASSMGVLEMGGESVQITFVPDKTQIQFIPKDLLKPIQLGPNTHNVFTYSWMRYGMEAGQEKLDVQLSGKKEHPCYIKGDTHTYGKDSWAGAGDFDKCRVLVDELMKPKDCKDISSLMCALESHNIPKIDVEPFYYIENFYYTLEALHVDSNGINYFGKMLEAGKKFCSLDKNNAEEIKTSFPNLVKDGKLKDYEVGKSCFAASWITSMLEHGFHLKDYTRFNVVRNVQGGDIDWAMGYIIQSQSASLNSGWGIYIYLFLFLFICVAIFYFKKYFQNTNKKAYQMVSQFGV